MMLPIMPWCRIDREYQVGDVTITPYRGQTDGAPALGLSRRVLRHTV